MHHLASYFLRAAAGETEEVIGGRSESQVGVEEDGEKEEGSESLASVSPSLGGEVVAHLSVYLSICLSVCLSVFLFYALWDA